MTDTDPREAKLPRWAREILSEERRKRKLAERRLEQQLGTTEPTSIWYGTDYDNPIYIPEDHGFQRVVFSFPPHRGLFDQFTVRVKDGVLEVTSGGRGMVVEPWASNVIRLRLKD
ncbi:hypothetical protein [Mycobacteroides chelonae]|uniref:DUF7239 family protein n=1 Tax=Mycobacteroides chelonae TaxID=1774 RepID=UPI0004AA4C11|nr:hypothetical protein [Mycobacteroides chelonae]OHT67797.1 hypothetical protein BKG66_24540 [Mycobacteroides chelonae]OHT69440.1 hypothetical protein BKG67_23075 [Mycobacteroides chelonae]